MYTKCGPCGDDAIGQVFDDGIYDGISKLVFGEDETHGVIYIKVKYMIDGISVTKQHGRSTIGFGDVKETVFALDYPNEYLTEIVVRSYFTGSQAVLEKAISRFSLAQPLDRNKKPSVVLVLRMKTSSGRDSEFGMSSVKSGHCYNSLLTAEGPKVVGLHGTSDDIIHSLGATFASNTSPHVRSFSPPFVRGWPRGNLWDDGDEHSKSVNKLWIGVGTQTYCVAYLKIQYIDGVERVTTHSHGKATETTYEFELENGEYLTSVECTFDGYASPEEMCVTSLRFVTSSGRSSPIFGRVSQTIYTIKGTLEYSKLTGFKGRSDPHHLRDLGAYFGVSPPVKVLASKGVQAGKWWDDGIRNDVNGVAVWWADGFICCVEFEYRPVIFPDYHGHIYRKGRELKEFLLPGNESLLSVEAFCSEYVQGKRAIHMLRIKTSSGSTVDFGEPKVPGPEVTSYIWEEAGHKIVGFFGRFSDFLEDIGVYVTPI